MRKLTPEERTDLNAEQPVYGEILAVSSNELSDTDLREQGTNLVSVFCVLAALSGRDGIIVQLESELKRVWGAVHPGCELYKFWRNEPNALSELSKEVAACIKKLEDEKNLEPYSVWLICLRLFEHLEQTAFRDDGVQCLAAWLKDKMRNLVDEQAFRLHRPMSTIPLIEAVLLEKNTARKFVAKVLLVSTEAVGANLSVAYRRTIQSIALEDAMRS